MTSQLAIHLQNSFDINHQELDKVLGFFKYKKVLKNEILLNKNETAKHLYFVLSGSVRAFFIEEDGLEATRYIAFENNFITSLNSFIKQEPTNEYLQATENGELLALSYDSFKTLLSTVAIWKDFYIKQLEVAYTTNHWRLESFIKMDAKQRYDYLIEIYPQMIQRLSNKTVASYLGITQESLSRIKVKR